jgi:hypothetical protein
MKNRVFLAILGLAVILMIGCATSGAETKGSFDSSVIAVGVPEGIRINFSDIPKDTSRILVRLQDATENYEIETFIDISSGELERIKRTGYVICPFTKSGHVYRISITTYIGNNNVKGEILTVAAIANGGVYTAGHSNEIIAANR